MVAESPGASIARWPTGPTACASSSHSRRRSLSGHPMSRWLRPSAARWSTRSARFRSSTRPARAAGGSRLPPAGRTGPRDGYLATRFWTSSPPELDLEIAQQLILRLDRAIPWSMRDKIAEARQRGIAPINRGAHDEPHLGRSSRRRRSRKAKATSRRRPPSPVPRRPSTARACGASAASSAARSTTGPGTSSGRTTRSRRSGPDGDRWPVGRSGGGAWLRAAGRGNPAVDVRRGDRGARPA